VLWEDLTVTSTVVTVDDKGRVSLAGDPRLSDGKVGHVTITPPSQPGLRAELDIPPRYDASFTSKFQGRAGFSGMDGTAGMDGMYGSMGSSDPANPSPGGDGTSGSNGSDGMSGRDGNSGWPGKAGHVTVIYDPAVKPFLTAISSNGMGFGQAGVDFQEASITPPW